MFIIAGEKPQSTFLASPKAYEITFQLLAQKTGDLSLFLGEAERTVVLKLIHQNNPNIAKELHESTTIRPYAMTPLFYKVKTILDKSSKKI